MDEFEALDVVIVGGGMSGLQCLRTVLRCGLRAVLLEAQPEVGGVWCMAYSNLAIQVPKRFYQLAELPLPDYMEDFPTAPSLRRYISEYAEHFNLAPHVRTSCRVLKISQRQERKDWDVTYQHTPHRSRRGSQQARVSSLINTAHTGIHSSQQAQSAQQGGSLHASPGNSQQLPQVQVASSGAGDSSQTLPLTNNPRAPGHLSLPHSAQQHSGRLPLQHPSSTACVSDPPPGANPSIPRTSTATGGPHTYTKSICARFVVVCTGLHSQPHMPDIQDRGVFVGAGGVVMHSGSFLNLQSVAGKHVVIAGGGKAAVDIACEVAGSGLAASCTAVFRQAHWPVPRERMWGAAKQTFAEWANSRAPLDVLPPYYDAGKLQQWSHAVKAGSKAKWWQGMQSELAMAQGLVGDMVPTMDMAKDVFHGGVLHDGRWTRLAQQGKLGTIKGEIVRFVAHGVRVKPVAREGGHMAFPVASMTGRNNGARSSVELGGFTHNDEQYMTAPGSPGSPQPQLAANGSLIRADMVIFATGYSKRYTFFDAKTQEKLNLQRDGLYLYRSIIPPGIANLAFIGAEINSYNNPLTVALQCTWLRHALQGKVVLPCTADMLADCAAQAAWKRAVMPPQLHRSAMLLLYMQAYHDQLCKDIGFMPRSGQAACCGGVSSRTTETPVTMDDFAELFETGVGMPVPGIAARTGPSETSAATGSARQQASEEHSEVLPRVRRGSRTTALAAQDIMVTSSASMIITEEGPCVVGGETVVLKPDGQPVQPQTQLGVPAARRLQLLDASALQAAGAQGSRQAAVEERGVGEEERAEDRRSNDIELHKHGSAASQLLGAAKAVLHLSSHHAVHTGDAGANRPKPQSIRSAEHETVGPANLPPTPHTRSTPVSNVSSAAALRQVMAAASRDELVCTFLVSNRWTAEHTAGMGQSGDNTASVGLHTSHSGQSSGAVPAFIGSLRSSMKRRLRHSDIGRSLPLQPQHAAAQDEEPHAEQVLQQRRGPGGRMRRLSAPLQAAVAYISAVAHTGPSGEHRVVNSRSSRGSHASRVTADQPVAQASGNAPSARFAYSSATRHTPNASTQLCTGSGPVAPLEAVHSSTSASARSRRGSTSAMYLHVMAASPLSKDGSTMQLVHAPEPAAAAPPAAVLGGGCDTAGVGASAAHSHADPKHSQAAAHTSDAVAHVVATSQGTAPVPQDPGAMHPNMHRTPSHQHPHQHPEPSQIPTSSADHGSQAAAGAALSVAMHHRGHCRGSGFGSTGSSEDSTLGDVSHGADAGDAGVQRAWSQHNGSISIRRDGSVTDEDMEEGDDMRLEGITTTEELQVVDPSVRAAHASHSEHLPRLHGKQGGGGGSSAQLLRSIVHPASCTSAIAAPIWDRQPGSGSHCASGRESPDLQPVDPHAQLHGPTVDVAANSWAQLGLMSQMPMPLPQPPAWLVSGQHHGAPAAKLNSTSSPSAPVTWLRARKLSASLQSPTASLGPAAGCSCPESPTHRANAKGVLAAVSHRFGSLLSHLSHTERTASIHSSHSASDDPGARSPTSPGPGAPTAHSDLTVTRFGRAGSSRLAGEITVSGARGPVHPGVVLPGPPPVGNHLRRHCSLDSPYYVHPVQHAAQGHKEHDAGGHREGGEVEVLSTAKSPDPPPSSSTTAPQSSVAAPGASSLAQSSVTGADRSAQLVGVDEREVGADSQALEVQRSHGPHGSMPRDALAGSAQEGHWGQGLAGVQWARSVSQGARGAEPGVQPPRPGAQAVGMHHSVSNSQGADLSTQTFLDQARLRGASLDMEGARLSAGGDTGVDGLGAESAGHLHTISPHASNIAEDGRGSSTSQVNGVHTSLQWSLSGFSVGGPGSSGSTQSASPSSRLDRYAVRMQTGADATLATMAARVSSSNLSFVGVGSNSSRARKGSLFASAALRQSTLSRSGHQAGGAHLVHAAGDMGGDPGSRNESDGRPASALHGAPSGGGTHDT